MRSQAGRRDCGLATGKEWILHRKPDNPGHTRHADIQTDAFGVGPMAEPSAWT